MRGRHERGRIEKEEGSRFFEINFLRNAFA